MKIDDMIALLIITGLFLFDYGSHPAQAAGLKSTPQLVVTPRNYPTKSEVFILASERRSARHRLWRREAVRAINKEERNTKHYVLKPVRVEGSHGHWAKNDERKLFGEEQNLIPDNNVQEDRKRQVVYDQFNDALRKFFKSNHSMNQIVNSRLPIANPARKTSLEMNEEEPPNRIVRDDVLNKESLNQDENGNLNSDSYKKSKSQNLLSYLPPHGIITMDSPSEVTSKGPDIFNNDRYRVSSFVGTFGIASNITDRKYSSKTDDHTIGKANINDSNMDNKYLRGSLEHQSNSNEENRRVESREDHNPVHINEQSVNSNIADNNNEVNDYNNYKNEHSRKSFDEMSRTNSNSRSREEDARSGSINHLDERTPLGKSLQPHGFINVYKVNGSHILGVRKIRPSKRARKLMFGKTKKIKPFPFSFSFRDKTICFPMKISTGENNKMKLSEFYNDKNLDEAVSESFRRDQRQRGAEQYQQMINQNNSWGSTASVGDLISYYDDDNKMSTLAPPIYKPGRAEVKFVPTDEDFDKTGIVVRKEDENNVYEEPDNKRNSSTHIEFQLAEVKHKKVSKSGRKFENEKDDMSIFIESKHEMTYVLPPKDVSETYRENSFDLEGNVSLSKDLSSLDIEKDISSKTTRNPFFKARPHWLVEHPTVRGRIKPTPSSSESRKLDHPVSFAQPWHRHPSVQTTSLPLRKWVRVPAIVTPTRRSSLSKGKTNGHRDDEVAIESHNTYYIGPLLRSISFYSNSSTDLDPTYRNWEEVANDNDDVSVSDFFNGNTLRAYSFLIEPSREKQYVAQESSYSPVNKKFHNNEMIHSAPLPLNRERSKPPLAQFVYQNDVYEITKPEMGEYYDNTDNLTKSIGHSSTDLPFIFQHPTTLAPSLSVVDPSVTAPTNLLIPKNENDERDYVQAKKFPGDIRNFYNIASRNNSLLTGRGRQSAAAKSPFYSRHIINSGEGLPSRKRKQTLAYPGYNQEYTSHGMSVLGSEETEGLPGLPPTTKKTATTKKKTPYDRIFRKSGILKSYYSDTTSDSENAEGSSSERAEDPDYPRYSEVPHTLFSCKGRYMGYYADPRAQCQVFHLCHRSGQKASFLCPNGTLFSQRLLTCDHWQAVDCERTEQHYHVNKDLYREPPTTSTNDSLFLKKNKIRFEDEETKNIAWRAEESQTARIYRLPPIPSLVTSDSSMESSSSLSLIPRYPGLKDLLQEKERSKKSYRKLKKQSKMRDQRRVPEPSTVRHHVVDPEMVQPYIVE